MIVSRRSALLAGAGLLLMGTNRVLRGANRRLSPDLVLYNGRVWTVDESSPTAEAVAIADGRILAVGSNEFVLSGSPSRVKGIDVGGKRITPGFIDAHTHPARNGYKSMHFVDCSLTSIEAIKAALRARAERAPPGEWIGGYLYDDGKTPRPLTLRDLDEAVPDRPVTVEHRGGHSLFINSQAMKIAGYDRNTPNPPNGLIEKDAAGNLTGKIADDARKPFDAVVNPRPSREELRNAAAMMSRRVTARGITSICDALGNVDILHAYRDAAEAGPPFFRVYCHIDAKLIQPLLDAGISTGFGNDAVRVGGAKIFSDGSISERTAWVSEPYVGTDFHGLPEGRREEIYELASKLHRAGWQLATHANGDLAIDEILGVYEQILHEAPRLDARPRIEHCTVVNSSLIARIKALKALPIPFSGYVLFHGDVMHFYGSERTKHMFAMRDFLDAGIPVPDSSDFGASPMDPALWLQSQVTRTDPQGNVWGANQRITVAEAVRCGTLNGAYSMHQEHLKGSLQPGYLADLVVWEQDPFTVDPSELTKISPQRTMIGGAWAYEA